MFLLTHLLEICKIECRSRVPALGWNFERHNKDFLRGLTSIPALNLPGVNEALRCRFISVKNRSQMQMEEEMSRLELKSPSAAQKAADGLLTEMSRRLASGLLGLCPVDTALSLVTLCHTQSCGKCVPCRVGLDQLKNLLSDVLEGRATEKTIGFIESTASAIYDSADCAIGYETARMVLSSVRAFRDDFEEHVKNHRCLGSFSGSVPCVSLCPAGVDIPGYVALVNAGRCEDAVRLVRKDNPFPVTCGYICEHPCETHCRRNMLDNAINIRALKRYAADKTVMVPVPACSQSTGKTVAVIGGGPGGLSAAYYLALMGHKVAVFERRKRLGGMLRYGIPAYRLPRELLDRDIDAILSAGVEARTNADIGTEEAFRNIVNNYDAVFVSTGAQTGSFARIEGENLRGVMSAVELLLGIGDDVYPDFSGKTVAIIGGGNVAMDVTRTAVRLGAKKVYCVYRRRQVDMPALSEEVEGAIAEGAELLTLRVPLRIEDDGTGGAAALWVKPQIPGKFDKTGRPAPQDSSMPEERIRADVIIVAVGQKIETDVFGKAGLVVNKGAFVTLPGGQVAAGGKIFVGGECVTGPATAIRAIAAGKVAAANIDEFLGFHHEISVDVDIPKASLANKPQHGRINTSMRAAFERKCDFNCIENGLTDEGASAESFRCLRCDYFGYGSFRGGREKKW